jgi:hypothetical protein
MRRSLASAGLVIAGLSLAMAAAPTAAMADTAVTPLGTLTATQADGPCNDFGAVIHLSVVNGFANTQYRGGTDSVATPVTFTTNGAGTGTGNLLNVRPPGSWTGTATITVSTNHDSQTATVNVQIACADPHG